MVCITDIVKKAPEFTEAKDFKELLDEMLAPVASKVEDLESREDFDKLDALMDELFTCFQYLSFFFYSIENKEFDYCYFNQYVKRLNDKDEVELHKKWFENTH